MQHVTLAQVRAKAYAAYMQSKLQAQALALGDLPTPVYEIENYEGRLCYCAIGASLTAETLTKLERHGWQGEPFTALVGYGALTCPDEEVEAIQEVQDAHDTWCAAPLTERELAEGDFLRLVRPLEFVA